MTHQQEIASLLRELSRQLDATAAQIESNRSTEKAMAKAGSLLKQAQLLRLAEDRLTKQHFGKVASLIVRIRHFLTTSSQEIVG